MNFWKCLAWLGAGVFVILVLVSWLASDQIAELLHANPPEAPLRPAPNIEP